MTLTANKPALSKNSHRSESVKLLDRVASIPNKSIADKYVGREIGGVSDFDLFDIAMDNGWNILIEGDTGAGKTMAAQAYAAHRGAYFYSTPNNVGIDPSQLFGKFIPDESGKSVGVWQDGPVSDLVRHGGVLLLNEISFLPPRVATSIFSLLDARREIPLLDHKGEVLRAHRGKGKCWCGEDDCDNQRLLVLADMNPGYLGSAELNQALRNRFEIQLDWDYDPKVEKKLVKSDQLLAFAAKVRKSRKNGDLITPTSTNMLVEFETLVRQTSLKFAMTNLVQHYAEDDRQAVQETLRTMEANFVESYRQLNQETKPKKESTSKKPGDDAGWDFLDDDEVNSWLRS